jgi:hypothetical protein
MLPNSVAFGTWEELQYFIKLFMTKKKQDKIICNHMNPSIIKSNILPLVNYCEQCSGGMEQSKILHEQNLHSLHYYTMFTCDIQNTFNKPKGWTLYYTVSAILWCIIK